MPSIPWANVPTCWTHGRRYAGCCLLITTWRGAGSTRGAGRGQELTAVLATRQSLPWPKRSKRDKFKVWRNLDFRWLRSHDITDIRPWIFFPSFSFLNESCFYATLVCGWGFQSVGVLSLAEIVFDSYSRRFEPWWPWELRLLKFFIIIIIIIIFLNPTPHMSFSSIPPHQVPVSQWFYYKDR